MKKLFFIAVVLFSSLSFGQIKYSITPKNEPLWLVDGLLINQYLVINLEPIHIKTIEILKDSEAVAIYGEKAKNGIVIIKTKNVSKKELKKLEQFSDEENQNNNDQEIKQISGIVTDCEDLPLKSAMISNLNTKETFYSNSEGKYAIKAHKNDVLLFLMEGFYSQRTNIQIESKIDAKLKMDQKVERGSSIMIKKPVIYLYPTQKTDISIQLDFKGKLVTTFPKYTNNWEVTAYPDGRIFDKKTNRLYTSLFWDGEIIFPKEHYQYKNGFIITKGNLIPFLIQKLQYMGLNTAETNDFIQYWLPLLEKNEMNFIHFWVNDDYDVVSKNIVTPKPDTSIRIFMDFYGLNKKIDIQEQQLPKKERKGFTLVEWGGSDVTNTVNKSQIILD
jgi:TonB-dependent SusC/RagA subfamily outer membrane receptor